MRKKILNDAKKPEIVITTCEYKIEIQLWCLDDGFGRQSHYWLFVTSITFFAYCAYHIWPTTIMVLTPNYRPRDG